MAPTIGLRGAEKDFYHDLYTLFSFETSTVGRSFDDHAALSYDAALTFITAVEYLREGNENLPVTPGTVWREITAIHNSQFGHSQVNNAIAGVSGQIDFGGDIDRHVPLNKPVTILQVENGEVDDAPAGFCGQDIDSLEDQAVDQHFDIAISRSGASCPRRRRTRRAPSP